jgi:hypothetical protein
MMWRLLVLTLAHTATGGPPGDSGRGGGGWSTTGWTSGSWSGGWQGGSYSGGGWNRREPPMPPPAGVATAGQPGEGGDVDTDEDEALWQAVDPPTAMDVDTTSAAAAVPEQRQITGGSATPPCR